MYFVVHRPIFWIEALRFRDSATLFVIKVTFTDYRGESSTHCSNAALPPQRFREDSKGAKSRGFSRVVWLNKDIESAERQWVFTKGFEVVEAYRYEAFVSHVAKP